MVGYLSFRNGEKAISTLAGKLMERTNNEVNKHLDSYLSIPHKVSQINADAIEMELLDVKDSKSMGKFFWKQMQVYNLSYIGYGLVNGSGGGAARYDGKTVTIDEWGSKLPNNGRTYATDNQGNRTTINTTFTYNNFEESWYTEAIKADKPIWSRIYMWDSVNGNFISASAVRPIYNQQKQLLGMIGADIHLQKLSDFLRKLDIFGSGQIFIIERNGLLIANSAKQQPFISVNGKSQRLKAVDSPDPNLKNVAQALENKYSNFQSIATVKDLKLKLQGKLHYINVTPWRDEYGLDWLVIMSVPENAFMRQIHANSQTTIILCLGALGVAIVLGILTSRWIIRPILRINQATQAMASGNLERVVGTTNILELNNLTQSFNHMAEQLHFAFLELENRVEERTVELTNTLKELQRTQAQMIQNEKMSSLGQMVAGVAHEINNPANFIHGNITYVSSYMQDLLKLIKAYEENSRLSSEHQELYNEIDVDFIQDDLTKILKSMQSGTIRIKDIVLSLRNFSRLDEAEYKQTQIHEGIDSSLMLLQNRLRQQTKRPEIQVIKEYGQIPSIECYASQLNQVFFNILNNAIDALEDSFYKQDLRNLSIWIYTSIKDTCIMITFSDNGIGIPKEVISKLFDPFFTTKPVGKGTGLGLSVSYQIVEKHQGKLWCESTPQEGTKFVIELPLAQNKN
ncbi:two-component sensor histidine kinase [Rivularia sp. IAM M-261]|nr:two-component sensor histidine kinase [Rivularia sp. IAM M-261]